MPFSGQSPCCPSSSLGRDSMSPALRRPLPHQWSRAPRNSIQPHLHIVAGVEGLQVKLPVRLGGPQAQVDGVVGLEAWDGVVVRHSSDLQVQSQLSATEQISLRLQPRVIELCSSAGVAAAVICGALWPCCCAGAAASCHQSSCAMPHKPGACHKCQLVTTGSCEASHEYYMKAQHPRTSNIHPVKSCSAG